MEEVIKEKDNTVLEEEDIQNKVDKILQNVENDIKNESPLGPSYHTEEDEIQVKTEQDLQNELEEYHEKNVDYEKSDLMQKSNVQIEIQLSEIQNNEDQELINNDRLDKGNLFLLIKKS